MTRIRDKAKADYEYSHWEDKGCEFEPSCLECPRPLSACPNEVPRIKQKIKMERKRIAVMALSADGLTTKEIAEAMRISQRTVQRALGGK